MPVYEDYLTKIERMFPGLSGSSSDAGAISDAEKNLQAMSRAAGSGSVSDKEYRALQQALANKAGPAQRPMGSGPISDRDAAAVRAQPVTRGALPSSTQRTMGSGSTSDQEAAAIERAQRVYMQQMKDLMQRDAGSGSISDREFQMYQDSLGGATPQANFDHLTNFFLNFNAKLRGR